MKKLLIATVLLIGGLKAGFAQNYNPTDTTQHVVNYNIYDELAKQGDKGAEVTLNEPSFLKMAMQLQISRNDGAFSMDGYRIRLYSDNKQNSRQASEAMVNDLALKYPNEKAYRTYSSPYFRVSIGNFRTLSEARAFLEIIKLEYPKAYPVKEKISFPPL